MVNLKQLFTNEMCLEGKDKNYIYSLLKISVKSIGSTDVFIALSVSFAFPKTLFLWDIMCAIPRP